MSGETPPPVALQGWTPTAVREGKVSDNPKGAGKLQAFYVDFVGADGFKANGTYWRRKEGNAPEVDKPVTGTITVGDYGYRFKIETGQGSTGSSGGGSYRSGGGGKSPDQQASIVRQHSQEMSLRHHAINAAINGKEVSLAMVLETADTYEQDANNASKTASGAEGSATAAQAGAPPTTDPPTPPQASDSQGVHELLTELFEKAGEAGPIATLLTGWVIETQVVEKQDKALAALREQEKAAGVVKWAREGYEARHGPLPAVEKYADDLPF